MESQAEHLRTEGASLTKLIDKQLSELNPKKIVLLKRQES